MIHRILGALANPGRIPFQFWKMFPIGSFELRLAYDIFPRPHYAFCLYHAARLAHMLGVPRISALEFGVAGGNGLVELERLAVQVERVFSTKIDIYGFDTGGGLPEPQGYPDLPCVWQAGFYEMNQQALERRLRRSQLVLGDVKDTIPELMTRKDVAPIGAVLLDLDYYSSTVDAMKVFEGDPALLLPRIFCYYDDVISSENGILSDRVGPLLAIREFNDKHPSRQMAPIAGFAGRRRLPGAWNEQIYVHHSFEHPEYCTYVHPEKTRDLPLEA